MKTTILTALVIAVFSLYQPDANGAQDLPTVTIGTNASGQSGYLAALIEAEGIAAKHHIKIKNLMMGFTEAANALKLGRVFASSMQPSTAVHLRKSGTEVRLFAPQIWSGNAWVVRKDSPYKTLADLKGKKIGNFSRVTGAYFFSAVIAKEHGLDIEKDFQSIPAATGALIALLERGEVEAINMFEPHVTKLVVSGRYRVLMDFDKELNKIFGTPPLKTGLAARKESVEKHAALIRSLRGAYADGIKFIKAGKDEAFFKAHAKEFFNLSTPEEIAAGIKSSRANYADVWGDAFFRAQNKILQTGQSLGLLPKVGNLNDLWIK